MNASFKPSLNIHNAPGVVALKRQKLAFWRIFHWAKLDGFACLILNLAELLSLDLVFFARFLLSSGLVEFISRHHSFVQTYNVKLWREFLRAFKGLIEL
jgi:hypothetical protein